MFVTSCVLGMRRVFRSETRAGIMCGSIVDDCRFYGAPLMAFVVMPDHFHALLGVPKGKTAPWLLQRIKSNSAKRLIPHLTAEQRADLACQPGARHRTIWMEGYRSIVVEGK